MHPDLDLELQQHGASLRALAIALLGASADADDVVQDTWLAALEHPPESPGPLGGWLHTVLRTLAGKARRSRQRRARRESCVARPETQIGEDIAAIHRETLRAVLDAVLALDEPYRSTIWQRYFVGWSPTAIAAHRAEPVATVKSRLQRGLAVLRKRLDREDQGRPGWRRSLGAALGIELLAPLSAPITPTGGIVLMKASGKLAAGTCFVLLLAAIAIVWFEWLSAGVDSAHPTSARGEPGNPGGSRELVSRSSADAESVSRESSQAASTVCIEAHADGRPLEHAKVYSAGVLKRCYAAAELRVLGHTGARGTLDLPRELLDASVLLIIDKEAFSPASVRLPLDASAEVVRVGLPPANSVHLEVVDLAGRPVSEVRFTIARAPVGFVPGATNASLDTRAETVSIGDRDGYFSSVTDSDGRATIRGLLSGSYRLQAQDSRYAVIAPKDDELHVRKGENELRIVLGEIYAFCAKVEGDEVARVVLDMQGAHRKAPERFAKTLREKHPGCEVRVFAAAKAGVLPRCDVDLVGLRSGRIRVPITAVRLHELSTPQVVDLRDMQGETVELERFALHLLDPHDEEVEGFEFYVTETGPRAKNELPKGWLLRTGRTNLLPPGRYEISNLNALSEHLLCDGDRDMVIPRPSDVGAPGTPIPSITLRSSIRMKRLVCSAITAYGEVLPFAQFSFTGPRKPISLGIGDGVWNAFVDADCSRLEVDALGWKGVLRLDLSSTDPASNQPLVVILERTE